MPPFVARERDLDGIFKRTIKLLLLLLVVVVCDERRDIVGDERCVSSMM